MVASAVTWQSEMPTSSAGTSTANRAAGPNIKAGDCSHTVLGGGGRHATRAEVNDVATARYAEPMRLLMLSEETTVGDHIRWQRHDERRSSSTRS